MKIFRDENEQGQDNKMYNDLQKAVKNIDSKPEVKSEIEDIKPEVKLEAPATPAPPQMYNDPVQRVITQNQQMALQASIYVIDHFYFVFILSSYLCWVVTLCWTGEEINDWNYLHIKIFFWTHNV